MLTLMVFFILFILVLDDYYAGLLRVFVFRYPIDKVIQGHVKFDQRVAGVASNLKIKRFLGLKNPFYSGQNCRIVIDDEQIFIGKAKYSSQLVVPLETIINATFSIRSVGFCSLTLAIVIDNNDYELKIIFFENQESALRKIFEEDLT